MLIDAKGISTHRRGRDIVHRWEGNPLLGIGDLDFQCSDIHNAGAVSFNDEILLLVTIEHLSGQRRIHLAHRRDKMNYVVDREAFLKPSKDPKYRWHETHGVLDARVTFLEGEYYIVYNAFGEHGYRLGIAKTRDFKTVERVGLVSEPDTKGGALFPRKIKGKYARMERPADGNSIWISYSDDMIYWGGSELVISPRSGFWDASRIGVAAVPIDIDDVWVVLYYGVKDTSAGPIYRLGAMILDHNEPTHVLGRAGIPILSPREDYERVGDVPNIVYSTGAVCDADGNLEIFYGAADSCICIGTTTVSQILHHCIESKEEY